MLYPILKLLALLMLVAGINAHFRTQQHNRKYKNTNPELVKLDSMITKEIDSLVVTFKK